MVLPVDERDRHPLAVARGRVDPLGDVVGRVESAENFVPLEQRLLARGHVVVVDRVRRRERGVPIAQDSGIDLPIVLDVGQVSGLAEVQMMPGAGIRPWPHAEADETSFPLRDDEIVAEDIESWISTSSRCGITSSQLSRDVSVTGVRMSRKFCAPSLVRM